MRVEENVMFMDNSNGVIATMGEIADSTYYDGSNASYDIDKFFSRPVLIKSYSWTSSGISPSDDYFDPWSLFLNNTAVKYKLNNYAFLQGRLHIKVVVNAAPFYYGARIMSYQPLPALTPKAAQLDSGGLGRMFASQRPNLWIFPQDSEAGELVLPFFFYKNWLDITTATEVAKMGRIYNTAILELSSANGATSNGATIQVFAWMDQVKLMGPTVRISMQGRDEYANGPVSGPATAIASMARMLKSVPIIQPYAVATEIGASAISKIAKLFGWTNVPVIENAMPFKSLPFHGITSASVSEPSAKLTLDPKAELTIDPRTVGIDGVDEMSLRYICGKESYLTQSTWSTSNAADTLLFYSAVTPSMFTSSAASTGGVYTIDFTPMGHASVAFNNWHGDIIFRFKIIASKFHRGRIQITWDPRGDLYTNGVAATTNVCLTRIVDISDETDVSVRIPYAQARPWLETRYILNNFGGTPYQSSSFSAITNVPTLNNGTISVRVLTTLSAPLDTASVTLVTMVSGADNLEFANPVDLVNRPSTYLPQSSDGLASPDALQMPLSDDVDQKYRICYGEAIPTIRTLMRRSTLVDILPLGWAMGEDDNVRYMQLIQAFKKYPPMPGFNDRGPETVHGWETTGTGYNIELTNMTYFGWFQTCYVGMRGSMRWHFNLDGSGRDPIHTFRVTRNLNTITSATQANRYCVIQKTATTDGPTHTMLDMKLSDFGGAGQALTNQLTQTSLSAELPHMNNSRFVSTDPYICRYGQAEDNSDRETYNLMMVFKPQNEANTSEDYLLERFVGIGTDFNFFFYLNAPRMFVKSGGTYTPYD